MLLFNGSAEDYAAELIEDTMPIPEHLRFYIDYKAIARDMALNSEIAEIRDDLVVINACEF